jgi:hypothetical protein
MNIHIRNSHQNDCLWSGRPEFKGGGRDIPSCHNVQTNSGPLCLFPAEYGAGSDPLHLCPLVSRFRMSDILHPYPIYIYISPCCGISSQEKCYLFLPSNSTQMSYGYKPNNLEIKQVVYVIIK